MVSKLHVLAYVSRLKYKYKTRISLKLKHKFHRLSADNPLTNIPKKYNKRGEVYWLRAEDEALNSLYLLAIMNKAR